jgi:MoaA/NifB/PqqE/SkfB family radical SAM enzyme
MSSPLKDDHIEYDPESGRLSSPPRQFFLELTGSCNLCCVHCPVDYGTPEGRARGELPFTTVEKLLPWLREAHSINLNIVGEPLIYSRFRDVLRLLGPACERAHFNSNGIALTKALARELVERRLGSIVISFDGRESNQAIRGVPYEFVRKKLELLCAEKRAQRAEAPLVGVAYTLMKRNLFELRPVLEDLARLGIQSLHVQPLLIFYEGLREENIYACAETDTVLQECKERAEALGIEMVVFRSQLKVDERNRRQDELRVQLGPYSEKYGCSDPFYEMKILHTGDVQACSRGMLTGLNVNDHGLDEIWNHPWYLELRQRLYAKRFVGLCSGCAFRFGSLANQESTLREGVHHSREDRLRHARGHAKRPWGAGALRSLLARLGH